MTTFDPWTSTWEEAERQPNAHETHGSVSQWVVAHQLTAKRETIDNGDGFSVLQAVAQCAIYALVMPDWLARAYLKRYRAVQHCKVESWDSPEAFGRPYPKGKHLSTFLLQRQYGFRLQSLFQDNTFQGTKALPRTLAGRLQAAAILGITEKQVRTLMPKTRVNVRGHKPYSLQRANVIQANDPFSLAFKRVPKK